MNDLKKYKFTDFRESRYIASEFVLKHIAVSPCFYTKISQEYQQHLPNCEQIEFADYTQRWYSTQREALREYKANERKEAMILYAQTVMRPVVSVTRRAKEYFGSKANTAHNRLPQLRGLYFTVERGAGLRDMVLYHAK